MAARMRRFLLACALAFPAVAQAASIEGLWLTEDHGGVIGIRPCTSTGPELCGWIVGQNLDPGEAMPLDVSGTPHCGLQLIQALHQTDAQTWEGGIRNPRDGKIYSARLRLDGDDVLRLRGYVLLPLFGSTQTWTRWTGSVTPPPVCHINPKPPPAGK